MPERKYEHLPWDEIAKRYIAGENVVPLSTEFEVPLTSFCRYLRRRNVKMRPSLGAIEYSGRTIDKNGYVLIYQPSHPFANCNGYVREHRLVMEKVLGRHLTPEEVVHHHPDVSKDCNDPEFLTLYATHAEHRRDEMIGNNYAKKPHKVPEVYKHWDRESILEHIRTVHREKGRIPMRVDLMPPGPSYRTANRYFGDWRTAVELATGSRPK